MFDFVGPKRFQRYATLELATCLMVGKQYDAGVSLCEVVVWGGGVLLGRNC